MTAQTWDGALSRARAVEDLVPHVAADIAVLTQLHERWRDSVDALVSMFGLTIVPSGAGWPPRGDGVFVRMTPGQASGERVVEVALYRCRGRASLAEPGATVLLWGDICTPATALVVVEAFLYHIASPAG